MDAHYGLKEVAIGDLTADRVRSSGLQDLVESLYDLLLSCLRDEGKHERDILAVERSLCGMHYRSVERVTMWRHLGFSPRRFLQSRFFREP